MGCFSGKWSRILVLLVAFGHASTVWAQDVLSDSERKAVFSEAVERAKEFESVDEFIQAFHGEELRWARIAMSSQFLGRLERSEIQLSLEEAENLSMFLVERFDSGDVSSSGREFMAKNPHPIVADPVFEMIDNWEGEGLHPGARILAALRDSRVLPSLEQALRSGNTHEISEAVGLMEQLGDALALPTLRGLLESDDLHNRLANAAEEQLRQRLAGVDREGANRQAAAELGKLKPKISRAIRNIQLLNEHGILCPFDLEEDFLDAVVENGFACHPRQENEIFEFVTEEYPFISSDLIFHTFMIMQRAALDELERFAVRRELWFYSNGMMAASLAQSRKTEVEELAESAMHNAAFFAVAIRLLDAEADIGALPEKYRDAVEAETLRIELATHVAPSSILGYPEDYTEYRPRGRQELPEQAGTFRAISWMGRACWPADSVSETRRALLLLLAQESSPHLEDSWRKLDQILTFVAGEREDPSFPEYSEIMNVVVADSGVDGPLALVRSSDTMESFMIQVAALPRPEINTHFIDTPGREIWQERFHGFRILGQRSTRDGRLLQSLIDEGHWPPSGVDVIAGLLGSRRAVELSSMVEAVDSPVWDRQPTNLVEAALWCLEPLFQSDASAVEVFQGVAWEEKQINMAMGGWVEARHAAAPYLKSAHTYSGCSGMVDDFHGYVEPYPLFYRRLAELTGYLNHMLIETGVFDAVRAEVDSINTALDEKYGSSDKHTRTGRNNRNRPKGEPSSVLYESELNAERLSSGQLTEFIEILHDLSNLAEKELKGEDQTINDGLFLKGLGTRLRNLSFNYSSMHVAEEPMSRIIDVATDYALGQSLKVGVGRPLGLYVAIPRDGRLFICRGGLYSYYEFLRPIVGRLDDATWSVATDRLRAAGHLPFLLASKTYCLDDSAFSEVLSELELQHEAKSPQMSGKRPWRFGNRWVGPWTILLADVEGHHIDRLLDLADNRSIHGNASIFALDRLVDFKDQARVREYFRSQVEQYLGQGERFKVNRDVYGRIYFAITALGGSELSEDRELLAALREVLTRPHEYKHIRERDEALVRMIDYEQLASHPDPRQLH